MSFACLRRDTVRASIDRLAAASRLTIVVGAGASAEAGVPDWRRLVGQLLQSNSHQLTPAMTQEEIRAWIDETIVDHGLPGAAAVVQALSDERGLDLAGQVERVLYPPQARYGPGPIALAVAALAKAAPNTALVTTNYDGLLEQALNERDLRRSQIKTYIQGRTPPAESVPVYHLHGYADGTRRLGKIVLSEEHYIQMQVGSSWQEKLFLRQLAGSHVLFVGISLTDPNIVRYLYRQQRQSRRHTAIFCRYGDGDLAQQRVHQAHERAAAARWARCGIDAVFVDHYTDVAQFLHEVILARHGASYQDCDRKMGQLIGELEREVIRLPDQVGYHEAQAALQESLAESLSVAIDTALGPDRLGEETIAVGLWLVSSDGRQLRCFANSDRRHWDPRTIDPVSVYNGGRWIAAQAYRRGGTVDGAPGTYASRWRFIRGIPLMVESKRSGARAPIGCVTLTSTAAREVSNIAALDAEETTALRQAIIEVGCLPVMEIAGAVVTRW